LQLRVSAQSFTFAENKMRFFRVLAIAAFFITAYSSCKKKSDSIDSVPDFYFLNGGSSAFNNNLILFSASDTITYNLIVSSTYLTAKPTTVTVGVADDYRVTYNTSNATDYKAMPAGSYSFETTFTTSTTNVYDTIPVTLYKHLLLDNYYMLPIKILSAGDYKIDSAASVIYLHTINNLLAGVYGSSGIKRVYIGSASDNNIKETDTFTLSKNLMPLTPQSSALDYADLGPNGWQYVLAYGIDGSEFTVGANQTMRNSIESGSFKVLSASFNTVTKDMYIKTSYKNLNGDERIVEESLKLQ
jgi:hypothetical protein